MGGIYKNVRLRIKMLDTEVNTEILEHELMKKIVLIENNMKEVLSKYILRNNQNLEKLEETMKDSFTVMSKFFIFYLWFIF